MTALVGTSGWQYRDWRGRFYPPKLAQGGWLEHYSEAFVTVEVNNTFYRLPDRSTFEEWNARTPDDFIFAIKASRYLTHIKRLRDPQEPIGRLLERARALGRKLGPILIQLPPNLEADHASLDETLDHFPGDIRVAVEFRHNSWFTPSVEGILKRHGAALCLADRGSRPIAPLWQTADWTYLRLHAGAAIPHPCYGRRSLDAWAKRLAAWGPSADVFVYFNNDSLGCAVRDAARFASAAGRHGLTPSRVPSSRQVHAG